MSIEEKRRELFEAWWGDQRYLRGTVSSYDEPAAWLAFNAALDAVEINLPKLWISNDSGASEQAACQTLNACKEAIESTGLGLKVKQ